MTFKNLPKLSIWQQALLHAFLVWLLFNLYGAYDYAARVARDGYFIFHEDGSPFTEWQRFWKVNSDFKNHLLMVTPFWAEIIYHLVFKRKAKLLFVMTSFLLACATVALLMMANLSNPRLTAIDFLPAFLLSLGYSFIYSFSRYAVHHQVRQEETKRQHTQAELQALKAQLNPHFFFNTLNSLYGTALLEKAEKTAKSVEQLSGIMRYVLTEAQQDTTDINNELQFLEDYLHLQHMRLPHRPNITLNTSIVYDGRPAQIAPLLLIPFLENAFKYGISLDHPCFVRLKLEVKEQQLDFMLENKLLPDRQADQGAGTGIAHVRKRLELLYPQRHQIEISTNEQFKVHLKLDLR